MITRGQQAPDFKGETTQKKTFHLEEHRGKTVVLFFFPAAFTPG